MDCFGLGGILVEEADVDTVVYRFRDFMSRWSIDYALHSTDIRGMRKNFSWLGEDTKRATRFHLDLQALMSSIPVVGIAAVVDRQGYNMRYKDTYGERRWQLCKTAYSILLERAAKYARRNSATLEIYFEGVGKKEDTALHSYHRELRQTGNPFDPENSHKYEALLPEDYKRIVKGSPRRGTKANIFLQIADIYLYSMAKYGYDRSHAPWHLLIASGRIIDAQLNEDEIVACGVKFSCFAAL
jgi:hypothetical protein